MAGASGYAGGEMLRLLLAHPEIEIGAAHRQRQRRSAARGASSRTCCRWPTACSRTTTAEALAGHDVVFLALPHGQSAASPPSCPTPTSSSSTAAPTSGSSDAAGLGRVLRLRRTPAPGPTACPSCPAGGPAPARTARGERRIAVPGCYPTAVSLALLPAYAAGLLEPTTSSSSPPPARPAPARRPSRTCSAARSWARCRPYGVGGGHRHTPEIEQNLVARGGRAGHRLLHPDPRADVPRHPRHLHAPRPRPGVDADDRPGRLGEGATPTSRSSTCCPRGSGPPRPPCYGSNAALLQVAVDERPAASSRQRHRQPHQGHRRRRRPVHEHRPRPPRGRPGFPRSESHRERHRAAQGFRGGRRRRRDQGERQPGPRPRRQRRAAPRRRRRLHLQPRQGRAVLWSRAGPQGRTGRRRRPQLRRRQRLHRARRASRTRTPPPRRSPRRSASRRGRRRRLLHRPHRRCGCPWTSCSPASTRPPRRFAPTAARRPPSPSRPPTPCTRPSVVERRRRLDRRRHGQGRGHARARPRHHARRAHHRRRRRRRDLDAALRAATRTPSTGSTPTAACPPTTPCCCWPPAPRGVTPDHDEFADGRHARSAPTSRGSCIGDAEGASKDITIEVVGAATEDDAVEVGRSIARNNLFKCAILGNDPNWGRVLAAIGTTAAAFDPDRLDVAINGVWVCQAGASARTASWSTCAAARCTIAVDLHAGAASRHDLDQRPHRTTTSTRTGVLAHERRPRPAALRGLTDAAALPRAARQGGDAHRGAALAERFRGELVVVKFGGNAMVDDDLKAAFAAGRRLPAPRRPQARRRARRRPADQRDARPARPRERVQGRPAGHHARGHGRRADGARRPGQRELVGLLNQHGPLAVGLTGEDAGTARRAGAAAPSIDGERGRHRPGRRRRRASTRGASSTLLDAGRIPVVSSIAPDRDDDGQVSTSTPTRRRPRSPSRSAPRSSWSSPTSRASTRTGRDSDSP